jgi:hypothetical protein
MEIAAASVGSSEGERSVREMEIMSPTALKLELHGECAAWA